MISLEGTTSNKTEKFLQKMLSGGPFNDLDRYGKAGVQALQKATPLDTGQTAHAWTYTIKRSKGEVSITWTNTHREGGAPVAVLIQYGHGTGTGGYVQGRDYINPAMRPIFDQIANDVWKQVTNG